MDTLKEQVIYFPVRHHSPACSMHLSKVLNEYQPDAVLVEGPFDANHLISHLGHKENKAPLSIYYSYSHEKGGEEEKFKSGCYFPFLDFSPELVGIRYGVEHEIHCAFIDLPYSELALMRRGESQKEGKRAYYDDYYLARSRYIERLCEKENCRHFGELWEKLFELQGMEQNAEEFVRTMLAFCHYARVEYPEELLMEEGCLEREGFMALQIQEAKKKYQKILVITGGFHTKAVEELVSGEVKTPSFLAGAGESYLIPYSFAESDQLEGYASGMPYPGFYQKVYELIHSKNGNQNQAYNQAVLAFSVEIGRELRKKKESISIADEIAAYTQSIGLCELREKPQQGVYELLDGVRSSYVKGVLDGSTALILRTTQHILRGDRMGEIASGVKQIPLLLDFQTHAKKYRLKIQRAVRNEITLELLSKPAHREVSIFFHRLDYLESGFGKRIYGPDYQSRESTRVREKWEYTMASRVQAALIDVSYLGGTIREAASTSLLYECKEGLGCGEYTALLIKAAVMDLTEHVESLLQLAQSSVVQDGNFHSLIRGVKNLLFLEHAHFLLGSKEYSFVEELLYMIYHRASSMLPTLQTSKDEEDWEIAVGLKDLYEVAVRQSQDAVVFYEALEELCEIEMISPAMQGSSAGLLYASGKWTSETVLALSEGYFFGTSEKMCQSGAFLAGLFLSAWDILFEQKEFLKGMDHVLTVLEPEAFLQVLPDMRLAFSKFTPSQIDRLAGLAAEVLGISSKDISARGIPEKIMLLGKELDCYAREASGGRVYG